MNPTYLLNYILHLGTGLVLLAAFMAAYSRATPYEEFKLIAGGNLAAAYGFGGAVFGFSLTLVSSVLHASDWFAFVAWAVAAGGVQVLTFFVLAQVLKGLAAHIENNNTAVGLAVGSISLATGAINAACLS